MKKSDQTAAALDAKPCPEAASEEEDEAWIVALIAKMAQPTRAQRRFFARRKRLGLGVGLNAHGELTWARRSQDPNAN